MLVLIPAGGLGQGGINFDAKVRRNSTDLEDLAIAHIAGMDVFAQALVTADRILRESPYLAMRKERYASYDSGAGAAFEKGGLKFEDLVAAAARLGEPAMTSGKQERYEQLLTMYLAAAGSLATLQLLGAQPGRAIATYSNGSSCKAMSNGQDRIRILAVAADIPKNKRKA